MGYRFGPFLGLGVEYRNTRLNSVGVARGADVLGLHLRGQLRRGWLASLGGGTVLSAIQTDDGFSLFEYSDGGYYLSADLGYQFRWGGIVGVYRTIVRGAAL